VNLKEFYFLKSGDERIIDKNLTENEFGFASFEKRGDRLIVHNVCGDGLYWDRFFVALAKINGCRKIVCSKRRSTKAYARKYGFKVAGYILEKEVE